MKKTLKNILAVIAGWFGGSLINMGLIQLGHKLIPIPGVDISDMEALAAVISTLEFEFFIFPFLAHALGTLIGAMIAGLIATQHKMRFSLSIGFLFLLGGVMVNYILPGPTWFAAVDIIFAYIPMAWIGGKLAMKISRKKLRKL